ncbi:RCC1 domain-containing protein, partial [Rhodococcus sp. BH5]|uniref:RCC1 domain-containing protein n=1 Tax=Rhodococcus sp. BH5 TaxID=2871702 RepID=UPI0022CD8352
MTISIPITVRVTGTTLNPVLDASGWSIPDELISQIAVSSSSASVTVSEESQNATVTMTVSAAVDARLSGEIIDLSEIVVTLSSGTSWHDSENLVLPAVVTGSSNSPPTVMPLYSADDRGDSALDFTPFADQVGDTGAGQLGESAYLKSFFSADDAEDGDLTDKVQVTSVPTFNAGLPGNYSLTGSVTDSGGLSADAQGKRDISVWNLVQVEVAYYNVIALDSRGRPWSWGANNYGENRGAADGIQGIPIQITNLPAGRKAVSVAAAAEASFVVMDDGSVYSFGADASGQLGNGEGGNSPTPTRITFPGNASIIKVDAFNHSVAALAADGAVYVWGNGDYGALGLGNATTYQSPQLSGISGVTDISMGLYGGIARTADGLAVVWGSNWHGQNGNGTTSTSTGAPTLPSVVPGLIGVTKVSAGYDFMLAATSDGEVYGWGANANYRANPNTGASTSDVTVPTRIGNLPSGKAVVQVNAGFDYGQVVYTDGSLWSWGYNSYDSLFIGNTTSQATPVQSPIASDVAIITGNYDLSLYLNKAGTMIYGRGYGGRWGLGNNSTANYISTTGTVSRITLTNLYRDGTGVDSEGNPTPLSTPSTRNVVAPMLRVPEPQTDRAIPSSPVHTTPPIQPTSPSSVQATSPSPVHTTPPIQPTSPSSVQATSPSPVHTTPPIQTAESEKPLEEETSTFEPEPTPDSNCRPTTSFDSKPETSTESY